MSALISGITGQDGGYLCEQLLAEGVQVHGLVRHGEQVPPLLEPLRGDLVLHEVDLSDEEQLATVFRAASPQHVYNLVGVTSVATSWSQPALTTTVNGTFAATLLSCAWHEQERRGEAVHFVQASSAEIFAGAGTVPQDEQTPITPRSPYGASKALAHHLVQLYRSRGLHASNAILYNHESPRRPKTFVTRKITSTAAAIATGRATSLTLGNLDVRRDWGWAPDYVSAMVDMAGATHPEDFVVATGTSHSVRELVATAFRCVGIDDWERYVDHDPGLERPFDSVELRGDSSRIQAALGWRPTKDFEEIVASMVAADATVLAVDEDRP